MPSIDGGKQVEGMMPTPVRWQEKDQHDRCNSAVLQNQRATNIPYFANFQTEVL